MTSPQIIDVKRVFSEAEAEVKRYERLGLDNLVSAINELRYAGHHVLDAQTADVAENRDVSMLKAMRHCERAKYDAQESAVIALLDTIAEYRQSGLTMEEMSAIYPEWKSCLERATEAQTLLESIGAVKTADAEALGAAILDLSAFRAKLLELEPQVLTARNRKAELRESELRKIEESKALDAQKRAIQERIRLDRQFLLSFTISAGGTLVGFLGTLIAIYGTFPEHRLVGMLVGCSGLLAAMFVLYFWAKSHLLSQ